MPLRKKSNGFSKKKEKKLKNECPIDIEVLCEPGPSNIHANTNGNISNQWSQSASSQIGDVCFTNESEGKSESDTYAVSQQKEFQAHLCHSSAPSYSNPVQSSPRKSKKNKFVKLDFDIEISCKPGPSTINSSVCSKKAKLPVEKKKSCLKISKASGFEWSIEEKDIPFPKHVKYGKATHSQSSSCYSNLSRGRQCTGNAVVSLVMLSDSFQYQSLFDPACLDAILFQGDEAYLSVSNGGGRLMELRHYDKKVITVNGDQYVINVKHSHQKLAKKGTLTESTGLSVPLNEALDVLLVYKKALVMMGEYAVAITFCHHRFMVFDSHGRIENGRAHDTGTASLWSFNHPADFKSFMYYQCIRYCNEAHPMVEVVPVIPEKVSDPGPVHPSWMDQYLRTQNEMSIKHNKLRIEKAKQVQPPVNTNSEKNAKKAKESEKARQKSEKSTHSVDSENNETQKKNVKRKCSTSAVAADDIRTSSRKSSRHTRNESVKKDVNDTKESEKARQESEKRKVGTSTHSVNSKNNETQQKNVKRKCSTNAVAADDISTSSRKSSRHIQNESVKKPVDEKEKSDRFVSKDALRMRAKRANPEYRTKEKLADSTQRKRKRDNSEYREAEQLYDTSRRKSKRLKPECREAEQSYNTKHRKDKRADHEYREAEQSYNTMHRQEKRADHEYREAEQSYNTMHRQDKRADHEYREAEQFNDSMRRQDKRADHEYREAEQSYNTMHRKDKRADPEYREAENEWHAEYRRNKRADVNFADAERIANSRFRAERRKNPEYMDAEREYNTSHRKRIRRKYAYSMSDAMRLKAFRKSTEKGCIFVCVCCHRILFRKSVVEYNEILIDQINKADQNVISKSIPEIDDNDAVDDKHWICKTCKNALIKGKIPAQSVKNGLEIVDLVDKNGDKINLKGIETTLIARHIPFMKIYQLPKSRISAYKDRVIHVPIPPEKVSETMSKIAMPRLLSEADVYTTSETRQVNAKRMLKYKNHYLSEYARPKVLTEAIDCFKRMGNPHYSNVIPRENYEELFRSEAGGQNFMPLETETVNDIDLNNDENDEDIFVDFEEHEELDDEALVAAADSEKTIEQLPSETELLDEAIEKAEEAEYLEYITKDAVKKWQWTNDDDIFMVDMCKENLVDVNAPNSDIQGIDKSNLNQAPPVSGQDHRNDAIQQLDENDSNPGNNENLFDDLEELVDIDGNPSVKTAESSNSKSNGSHEPTVNDNLEISRNEAQNPVLMSQHNQSTSCKEQDSSNSKSNGSHGPTVYDNLEISRDEALKNSVFMSLHDQSTSCKEKNSSDSEFDISSEPTALNDRGSDFEGPIDMEDIVLAADAEKQVDPLLDDAIQNSQLEDPVLDNLETQNNSQAGDIPNKANENSGDQAVDVAPGEGQIPVNPRTIKDWDVKACPNLFPDGKGGLHQERDIKLSTKRYADARILNKDNRFASDKVFTYSMADYIDREELNKNINISGNKGTLKTDASGKKVHNLKDPYAVLDKISNSPKFWKAYKADVIARLKNKGPFQIFYTLSCAEQRWMENLQFILRKKFGKDLNLSFKYVDEEEIIEDEDLDEILKEFTVDMEEVDDVSEDLMNLFNDSCFELEQEETTNSNAVSGAAVVNDALPKTVNDFDKSFEMDPPELNDVSRILNNSNDSFDFNADNDRHETSAEEHQSVAKNISDSQSNGSSKPTVSNSLENSSNEALDNSVSMSQHDQSNSCKENHIFDSQANGSNEPTVSNEALDNSVPISQHDQSNSCKENNISDSQANGSNEPTVSNDKESDEKEREPRVSLHINGMPWKQYLRENNLHLNLSQEMKNNVLMLTRHFDHRLRMFTKFYLDDPNAPMHPKYYTFRIEFQARGAGHAHGLIWLDLDAVKRDGNGKIIRDPETNEPTLIFPGVKEAVRKIKNDQKLNEADLQNLIAFSDRFVTVSLSDPDVSDLVKEVNTHHHTRTCRKYDPNDCRFHFPRYPTLLTIIAIPYIYMEGQNDKGEPLSLEEKKAKFDDLQQVLSLVKATLKDDDLMAELEIFPPKEQIEELCRLSKVTVEDYEMALRYTFCSYAIHHKRTIQERMVNNYNKEWIVAWNGNMDIQICLDFYAIITYISDYVTKDESGVTRAMIETLKKVENLSYLEKLYALADVFCTHRSMGEAEVFYRILSSLHLTESNLKVEFLPTGFPEHRSKFYQEVHDDSDDFQHLEGERVGIEGKEGRTYVEKPSVIDKYMRRPAALERMSLMQFVKVYDGCSPSSIAKGIEFKNGVSVVSDNKYKLTKGKDIGDIVVAQETEDIEYHKNRYRDFNKILIIPENDYTMSVDKYRELLLPVYIEISDPKPGERRHMKLRENPKAIRTYNYSNSDKRNEYHYSELLQYHPFRDEKELYEDDEQACAELYQETVKLEIPNVHDLYEDGDMEIVERMMEVVEVVDEDEDWQIVDKVFKINRVKSIVMEHLEGVEEGKKKAEEILSDRVGAVLDPEHEQELDDGQLEGMQEHPEHPALDAPDVDIEQSHRDRMYREIDLKPEEDLYKATRLLDEEQMMVLEECVQFAKQLKKYMGNGKNYPQEIPKLMVQGGAGAGKSTVISTIIQWMERILRTEGDNPEHPYILPAAPTGAAAAVIDGNTLHSTFGLNFSNEYIPLNDKQKHLRRTVLKNLKVLIIDEISMVKSDMLYQLHLRLQEVMEQPNEPFGGVAVFCFGDLLQLRPVQAKYVFEEPDHERFKVSYNVSPLWRKFKSIKLVKNHRQGEDGKYADLLNRARVGKLNDEDIEMLQSRVISADHPDIPDDAQYVVATNSEVRKINEERLAKLNTEEHIEEALNLCRSRRNYKPVISEHGFVGSTQFKNVLKLKVGARIMLTNNIDVHDSLTNGAIGTVLGYKRKNGRVSEVIVKFNNPKSGKRRRSKPENADLNSLYGADNRPTPIGRQDFEYTLRKKSSKCGVAVTARVIQFPLRLAFAATAHKFQGQTVCRPLSLVIDLRGRLQKAQAYVMLSRVQSLDQVFILEKLHHEKIQPCAAAVEELDKLDENAVPKWSKPNDKEVISFQNVRSLEKHLPDVKLSKRHINSDVVTMSETWLSSDDDEARTKFEIENLGKPMLNSVGRGKGLAIYSRNGFEDYNQVKNPNYQISKLLYSGQYIIISVYRSKSANCNDVLSDILKLCKDDKLTVIGGDFNICALSEKNNPLVKGLREAGFRQLVNEATHIKGRVIDHCYVREPVGYEMAQVTSKDIEIRSVYFSDHDSVILYLPKVRIDETIQLH